MNGAGSRPVVQAKVRIPHAAGLDRERLDLLLDRIWRYRLGLVVAPAGSGKTTLIARYSSRCGAAVAWYRAETTDRSEAALVHHLRAAFAPIAHLTGEWRCVEDAVLALERWDVPRVLLVVDDLHALEATPAEAALERFIENAPRPVVVLVASRVLPRFNLSRLRLSGDLLEISQEDLRFRSWEVERLFRDFYHEAFLPEELAELARRTDGWAAGLQLFHLAVQGRSPEERRRILSTLAGRSRLVREYLARNVLEQLPIDLRHFLTRTSVLGRLTGPLCDQLLNSTGSKQALEELERRQVFTASLDDDGSYRYHEVLRSQLEQALLEELGEERGRTYYHRAAQLLESARALPEAIRAYCRAEQWASVERLLVEQGSQLAGGNDEWLESLPPATLDQDPWLLLARARRHRASGRWSLASESYQMAETAFGGAEGATVAHQERAAILAWLGGPTRQTQPLAHWTALLRVAVTGDPLGVRQAASLAPEPARSLVSGLAALLAGRLDEARRELSLASVDPRTSNNGLLPATRLACGVANLMAGDLAGLAEIEDATDMAERIGSSWMARLGRACRALRFHPAAMDEAAAIRMACDRDADPWTAAVAALLQGWGEAYAGGKTAALLDQAAWEFQQLGARVLEAWARGLLSLALARQGDPTAQESAQQAERLARTTATPAACYFAYQALARMDLPRASDYRALAQRIEQECGLWPLDADAVKAANPTVNPAACPPTESVAIRCLGGFSLAVNGRQMDITGIKPRARGVLRFLAVSAGKPLHREVLQEAFWPEAQAEAGSRSLNVALCSVRQLLERGASGGCCLLRRDGDSYRLVLAPGSAVDTGVFEEALNRGRERRLAGDLAGAMGAFRQAVEAYSGELLPEEGPAEWILEKREYYRFAAIEAAESLAETALALGKVGAAAEACERGLAIERSHDPFWRLFIEAEERAGNRVTARRARLNYAKVLSEFGIANEVIGAPGRAPVASLQ